MLRCLELFEFVLVFFVDVFDDLLIVFDTIVDVFATFGVLASARRRAVR